MAHFRFVTWLVEWLLIQTEFVFEWDEGNRSKNLQKHGIQCEEIEEVFEQVEAIRALGEQARPTVSEPRFGILGLTKAGRHLFVCFTLRGSGLRIVHAREMNRKERKLYVELCEK